MSQFFQFEADFVESLRCIPMQVRFKLDTCGVKLKLHQWNQFTQADREALVEMPCQSAADIQSYHDFLHQMIQERTGETATDLPVEQHPAWEIENIIPDSVVSKVKTENATLETVQWAAISPLQRFALIKLSRSNHENSNFMPAMREFGLI
ncbi:nitrate reductase associated protein [Alkalinema pantanalense CENA528]|uniref:nitrate reductase associated protein n=1 Tax=Alkalinema pantanalense TaxID=1620705 RepID=UPI003D701BD6